ncbi:MAG: response regulator transcription factor [Actinobacteria bacterium]|nr:response regulator transcription factor [Actinomycetota bacterium]
MQVVLADKSATIRSALRLLVEMETRLRVTGEADSGDRLLDVIEATHPDLIVVDWELPGIERFLGGDSRVAVTGSRATGVTTQVIVLGNDPQTREEALSSGADYFFSKGDSPERLLEAISAAVESSRQIRADHVVGR